MKKISLWILYGLLSVLASVLMMKFIKIRYLDLLPVLVYAHYLRKKVLTDEVVTKIVAFLLGK